MSFRLLTLALCAGASAMMASGAFAQPQSCRETLQWTGSGRLASRVLASLADGPLADAPSVSCAGVVVDVEPCAGGVAVTVHRGVQSVTHTATDTSMVGTWIESWLAATAEAMPATEAAVAPAPAAAPPATARPAPPATRPAGATPLAPSPAASIDREEQVPLVPLLVAVRTVVDVDPLSPFWAGGAAELALGLGRYVWLGFVASGTAAPEQDHTSRFALRLSARSGWRTRLNAGLLRVGGGIGIVSAGARRENADQTYATDEEAGPYLEVLSGFDAALGGPWSLSVALAGRVHVPDDALEGVDTASEASELDPAPLPTWAFTFEAGISYDAGGTW